ncbi:MAG TPA: FtsW/RodA/SpoVE family cell cycle protein [Clostridiales bacterium]|nr:FtsW/RodA/SpoVE family cell cycle protein [Clostridiales bacterium]
MEQIYHIYYTYFLAVSRWLLPLFGLIFTCQWIRCLMALRYQPVSLGALVSPEGKRFPLTAHESSVGGGSTADVAIPSLNRRRKCAVIVKKDEWYIYKTLASQEVKLNGQPIDRVSQLEFGDILQFGDTEYKFMPPSAGDCKQKPKKAQKASAGALMFWLIIFQIVMLLQLLLKFYPEIPPGLPIAFLSLFLIELVYFFIRKAFKDPNILAEMQAFFLVTIGLGICTTAAPATLIKQAAAVVLGFLGFVALWQLLKSPDRAMKLRYIFGGGAVVLLILNLIFGKQIYGARNWIDLGIITFQPSEFVKVAFIAAGSAALYRLLATRNAILFMGFSAFLLGCLALIRDFGGLLIFFVTMMVIIFLRTGDIKTIIAISALAVTGGVALIVIMPHISSRFKVWRHVWEYANSTGFQQTRTLTAAASGGLLGVGGGNGYLDRVAASDTDLVFGIVCEEWGLILGLCVLASFILLSFYAFKFARNAKSAYYSIAVCATAALLLFQAALNIFGSTDILPLTGVTLPFVSNGGTSMVASFGLLSFFKGCAVNQGGARV